MNETTIERAKKHKKDLEKDIHSLINVFCEETGLVVKSVELVGDRTQTSGGTPIYYIGGVYVEVGL